MKKLVFLILSLISFLAGQSQTIETLNKNDSISHSELKEEIFTVVEEQASFPGGMNAMYKFLSANLVYPPVEKEKGIQGTLFIQFVVEKDGSLSNYKTLRGIEGGHALEEEAIRVLKLMPEWIPGRMKGKPVRMFYTIPFKFQIK